MVMKTKKGKEGVAMCAVPGCSRQLKPNQGKQSVIGRVCFGHPEVAS